MRCIGRSGTFKSDFKKASRGSFTQERFRNMLSLLQNGEPLPEEYDDHSLKGTWTGPSEYKVAPDLCIIHKVTDDAVKLVRIGNHGKLLG